MPNMPHTLNAKYNEWKIVFEGVLSKIKPDSEITLLGNSLGGCFLLKFFAEKPKIIHYIDQIHLVAACISEGDFTAPMDYSMMAQFGGKIHIWHAEDDAVVPFSVGQTLL